MQIVNCLPLFSSRNICRGRWRVRFSHNITLFTFSCDKRRFQVFKSKSDCLRSNVTKSEIPRSKEGLHISSFLQKTAFSLVKSRLALGSPGWSFVCHHAENAPIHRADNKTRNEEGLVKPAFCIVDTGSCFYQFSRIF